MKVCDMTISFVLSLTLLYEELGLGGAHEMGQAGLSMQAQAQHDGPSNLGMHSSYQSSYVWSQHVRYLYFQVNLASTVAPPATLLNHRHLP